jgi:photosystem II biogenesis protein Psp29
LPFLKTASVSNVPTVSDTKRAFYNHHARPITSVYRRVVEELMVEMHLLRVNTDFVYDPVYALGIVTTFDRFMDGYQPEGDRDSIFNALCQANEGSPEQYRQDAQALLDSVSTLDLDGLKPLLLDPADQPTGPLKATIQAVKGRDRFKYSRAFAIGLYVLVETVDQEFTQDKEKLMELFKTVAEGLSLSFDKLQKDIELYRSNLSKMVQAKAVMADILAADRKKREERAQALAAKDEKASAASDEAVATPATEPSDDTPTPDA